VDAGSQKRAEYLKSTLLDPVIHLVLSKPLTEDEAFLGNLSASAPELVVMIRTKIWTAREVRRVPAETLRETVMNLSSEQRGLLLYSLPESEAAHIESALPEGNARTILSSQVKKLRARNDSTEQKTAIALGRQFLDYLRREAERGRISLLTEESGSRQAAEAGIQETKAA
jgi:hypothetical protein